MAVPVGALPSEAETVISQLARTVYHGRGLLYLGTIAATTIILIMAANTSFADFPRLGALIAGDRYLPRQLAFRGSRLVYSWGIAWRSSRSGGRATARATSWTRPRSEGLTSSPPTATTPVDENAWI